MSLSLDIQDDLADLLDDPDYGRKVVLKRSTPGTYDPSTGETATATASQSITRGLLLSYRDSLVNGSLIRQGDRKCIFKVRGMTLVPQAEDIIEVYNAAGTAVSENLRIVDVKRGELGGTSFLYVAQVRL